MDLPDKYISNEWRFRLFLWRLSLAAVDCVSQFVFFLYIVCLSSSSNKPIHLKAPPSYFSLFFFVSDFIDPSVHNLLAFLQIHFLWGFFTWLIYIFVFLNLSFSAFFYISSLWKQILILFYLRFQEFNLLFLYNIFSVFHFRILNFSIHFILWFRFYVINVSVMLYFFTVVLLLPSKLFVLYFSYSSFISLYLFFVHFIDIMSTISSLILLPLLFKVVVFFHWSFRLFIH